MERELKFVLTYSKDKRDLNSIKDEFKKSDFDGHVCVSFKVLDKDGEEISYSEFTKISLEKVKKENYSFIARKFNDKNLSIGDYGILKENEKNSSNKNFYIVKIREIGDLEFATHTPSIDKEVLNYIEKNMKNKENYKARYIYFDADKNSYFEKNKDFGNNITGETIIEKIRHFQGTLLELKPTLLINWE